MAIFNSYVSLPEGSIDVRPVRPEKNWESGQADKGKLYFIQLNDGSIPLDIQADFLPAVSIWLGY